MNHRREFVLTLLFCLFGLGQYVLADQYFDSRVCYLVGDYPDKVTAYDVNGDTYPDLIVANDYSNNISVLLGHGDGTFAGRLNYALSTNQYPKDVKVGDVNGDDIPDLITGGLQGLDIFYGNGDGTFGAAQLTSIPNVTMIAIGFFNADTLLDIAATDQLSDSMSININNGDSTFTTSYVHVAYGSRAIIGGKFDIDAYPDLVVNCQDGSLWNLRNDGSGGFTAFNFHTDTCASVSCFAAADFNGNTVNDLAVANRVTDSVTIYLNNGDGTYAVSHNFYAGGDQPVAVTLADVNSDGELDLLISSFWDGNIKLHLGDGNGAFTFNPNTYYSGGQSDDVYAADLNGDTYVDLIATDTQFDSVAVFMSRMPLILDVPGEQAIPTSFTLAQNYPNPFNPETRIEFSLPQAADVRVEVFNMLGQSVKVLVDEHLSAGTKEISWDGTNEEGKNVASGMYLYRVSTDRFSDTKKMVLLR
jgi:hypothetical protein